MSVTGKAALGLAVLALAGGAGLAAASPAGAATAACGNPCMTLSGQDLGSGYVTAVAGGIPVIGAPVRLSAAAASQAEDWQETDAGNVTDLAAQGLVSPEIGTLYAGEEGYEFQFAPNGVASGLCLGLATAAHEGGRVTLRRCAVSSRTIWVANLGAQHGRFVPLVPGSDTSSTYDQNLVLTGSAAGRALTVSQLSESDGIIASDQMWQTIWGVLS
jgi:hypothetical protein